MIKVRTCRADLIYNSLTHSLIRKKTFTIKLLSTLLLYLQRDGENDMGFLKAKEALQAAYLSINAGSKNQYQIKTCCISGAHVRWLLRVLMFLRATRLLMYYTCCCTGMWHS